MKNMRIIYDIGDIDANLVSAAEESRRTSKRGYKIVLTVAACAGLFLAAILIGKMLFKSNRAYAESYSYEPYDKRLNAASDVTKEFSKNIEKSDKMVTHMFQRLPYTGKYPAGQSIGKYTVDLISADGFPDYYAGKYINVDGKLIIPIKEIYYTEKFRECDWYEELVELLGSEDFGCRPVKYNYTELMNGMSDIIWGSLGQTIKDLGVEVSGVLLDDYRNGIIIRVRTEEDALKIQPMLPGDMYRIEVFNEEMWS